MKRLIRLFCLIAAATALGSCARDKVIPDEELARIFRDAYLINAYVSDRGVKLDSLELYEPVFSRYGYTAEDVRYTIGNFSRRKSAKLSDVVEQSGCSKRRAPTTSTKSAYSIRSTTWPVAVSPARSIPTR